MSYKTYKESVPKIKTTATAASEEEKTGDNSVSLSDPNISQTKYPRQHPVQLNYRENVVQWIVGDGMPVGATDGYFYRKMMQAVDHKLTIPSRRTVGRDIDKKYDIVR